jgi:hypothetical protein
MGQKSHFFKEDGTKRRRGRPEVLRCLVFLLPGPTGRPGRGRVPPWAGGHPSEKKVQRVFQTASRSRISPETFPEPEHRLVTSPMG